MLELSSLDKTSEKFVNYVLSINLSSQDAQISKGRIRITYYQREYDFDFTLVDDYIRLQSGCQIRVGSQKYLIFWVPAGFLPKMLKPIIIEFDQVYLLPKNQMILNSFIKKNPDCIIQLYKKRLMSTGLFKDIYLKRKDLKDPRLNWMYNEFVHNENIDQESNQSTKIQETKDLDNVFSQPEEEAPPISPLLDIRVNNSQTFTLSELIETVKSQQLIINNLQIKINKQEHQILQNVEENTQNVKKISQISEEILCLQQKIGQISQNFKSLDDNIRMRNVNTDRISQMNEKSRLGLLSQSRFQEQASETILKKQDTIENKFEEDPCYCSKQVKDEY
jgi:hypothetical protein